MEFEEYYFEENEKNKYSLLLICRFLNMILILKWYNENHPRII